MKLSGATRTMALATVVMTMFLSTTVQGGSNAIATTNSPMAPVFPGELVTPFTNPVDTASVSVITAPAPVSDTVRVQLSQLMSARQNIDNVIDELVASYPSLANDIPVADRTPSDTAGPSTNSLGSDDDGMPPGDYNNPDAKKKKAAAKGWCSPRIRALQQYDSIVPATVIALAIFSWTMRDAQQSSVKTKRALCFFAWLGFTFALVMTIGDGFCIAPAPEGPASFHSKIVSTAVAIFPGACVTTWEYWKEIDKEQPGFINMWFGWIPATLTYCFGFSFPYFIAVFAWIAGYANPCIDRITDATKFVFDTIANFIEACINGTLTAIQICFLPLFNGLYWIVAHIFDYLFWIIGVCLFSITSLFSGPANIADAANAPPAIVFDPADGDGRELRGTVIDMPTDTANLEVQDTATTTGSDRRKKKDTSRKTAAGVFRASNEEAQAQGE